MIIIPWKTKERLLLPLSNRGFNSFCIKRLPLVTSYSKGHASQRYFSCLRRLTFNMRNIVCWVTESFGNTSAVIGKVVKSEDVA